LKVRLEWGPRVVNAKFDVEADDLESAWALLIQRGKVGSFKWNLRYVGREVGGRVASVTLEPTFSITMPNWIGYRDQPQECKDEWDAMWQAAYEHEHAHRQQFEARISQLVSDLEAMRSLRRSEFEALMKKAQRTIDDDGERFDRGTDDGRSRGVGITLTDKCRKKKKEK